MIVTAAVAAAISVVVIAAGRRRLFAAVGAATLIAIPIAAVMGSAVMAVGLWVHRRRTRAAARASVEADVPLLAELTALGLSAGMPFPIALSTASEHVSDDLGASARAALRSRVVGGHGHAAAGAESVGGLFRVVGTAELSGAPLLPAVTGYVDRLRAEERSQRLATEDCSLKKAEDSRLLANLG